MGFCANKRELSELAGRVLRLKACLFSCQASITFISDVLYMLAMLKTSPLAVTLGLSLTIPVAVVGDLFKGTELGGPSALIGAALVLGSFVAIGWSDNAAAKAEDGRSADSPEV